MILHAFFYGKKFEMLFFTFSPEKLRDLCNRGKNLKEAMPWDQKLRYNKTKNISSTQDSLRTARGTNQVNGIRREQNVIRLVYKWTGSSR